MEQGPEQLEVPKDWKARSPEQKAEWFAATGDINTISSMITSGSLDKLDDFSRRKLFAAAANNAAKRIEKQAQEGKYIPQAYENQGLAEAYSTAPRLFRTRALEVLLNPEGIELKKQLESFITKPSDTQTE